MTSSRIKNKPKALMERLTEDALMARFLFDRVPPPGEIISRLSPEDRLIIQTLTAQDISDTRWTRPEGINLEKLPIKRS